MSNQSKDVIAAAGNLLTTPGLIALAGVFVLAAWYSQAGIALLTGLFLSTAGLARLWNRVSLAGVRVARDFNGTRFFPDEPIECRWRLINRNPLPLFWVQLNNDVPAGVGSAAPADERHGEGGDRNPAGVLSTGCAAAAALYSSANGRMDSLDPS